MAIGNSQADASATGSGIKLSLIIALEVAKDEYVLALEVGDDRAVNSQRESLLEGSTGEQSGITRVAHVSRLQKHRGDLR